MDPDGFVVNWLFVVSISDVMEVISQLCSPAVPSCDSRSLPSISGSGSLILSSFFVPNDSFLVSMWKECSFSWICSDPDDMGLLLFFFMVVMEKSNQVRALGFSALHLSSPLYVSFCYFSTSTPFRFVLISVWQLRILWIYFLYYQFLCLGLTFPLTCLLFSLVLFH